MHHMLRVQASLVEALKAHEAHMQVEVVEIFEELLSDDQVEEEVLLRIFTFHALSIKQKLPNK